MHCLTTAACAVDLDGDVSSSTIAELCSSWENRREKILRGQKHLLCPRSRACLPRYCFATIRVHIAHFLRSNALLKIAGGVVRRRFFFFSVAPSGKGQGFCDALPRPSLHRPTRQRGWSIMWASCCSRFRPSLIPNVLFFFPFFLPSFHTHRQLQGMCTQTLKGGGGPGWCK